MKPTNKEIQDIKDKLKEVNSILFKTFGREESLDYRAKINDVLNDLYWLQKNNYQEGDNTVKFL